MMLAFVEPHGAIYARGDDCALVLLFEDIDGRKFANLTLEAEHVQTWVQELGKWCVTT